MYQKIDGELYEKKESLGSVVLATLTFVAFIAVLLSWASLVS